MNATKFSADGPEKTLPEDDPAMVRKRILFISVVLGLMFGVTVFLVLKATRQSNPIFIVAALPMFLAAIPMTRTLVRLRKTAVK